MVRRQLTYISCVLFLFLGFFEEAYSQENEPSSPLALTLKEAILKNLLQQSSIQISLENINVQKGLAQSSAAPFDPVINSDVRATYTKDLLDVGTNVLVDSSTVNNIVSPIFACGPLHTNLKAYDTVGHLDISKQTRAGTRYMFNLDVEKNDNPLNCPIRLKTTKMAVEVNQPLLRGREYGLDRMTELANRQEVNAVRYETLQFISEQVLKTTSAYWDVVSRRKNLKAQIESEKRLSKLVDDVKFLIEQKQLAGGDLIQPLAQLSSQVVSRIAAEQEYYNALQQLKFVMGEWNEDCPCEDKRFDALDEFPFIQIDPEAFSDIFCHLFPQVYRQRFDILASVTREGVYTLLLQGAKNLELPRLDVVGRVSVTDGKSGHHANTFSPTMGRSQLQKDFTVGIVFSTPLYQDEARGLIRQRQAEWTQMIERTRLLKQQALNDINKALMNHISLQNEIQKAQQAVDEYYLLLKNEKKKLIAGYSTIFIFLNFETYLVDAVVQLINLQTAIAKNIATLRFLTGTLIRFSPLNCCQTFVVEDATQLPF